MSLGRDQQAILDLLRERGADGATTSEIVAAGYNGYRGRISELRNEFGYTIECKYVGRTADRRPIHRYFLIEEDQPKLWDGKV